MQVQDTTPQGEPTASTTINLEGASPADVPKPPAAGEGEGEGTGDAAAASGTDDGKGKGDSAAAGGDDQGGESFEKLQRHERKLLERNRELNAREQRIKEAEDLSNLAKTDPIRFLRAQGLDTTEIIDKVTGDNNASKPEALVERLSKRIEQLEQGIQTQNQESQAEKRDRIMQGVRDKAKSFLQGSDEYSALSDESYVEQIIGEQQKHAIETQELHGRAELLPYDKAAAKVFDSAISKTLQLLKNPRAQKALAEKFPGISFPDSGDNHHGHRDSGPTTLTNEDARPVGGTAQGDDLPLDPDARVAALLRKHRV